MKFYSDYSDNNKMISLTDISCQNKVSLIKPEERLVAHNLLRNTELTLKDNLGLFKSALKFVDLPSEYSTTDNLCFKTYDRLVKYILAKEPRFYIKLFKRMNISDLGILGYAMMHSVNFKQALTYFNSYHRFSNNYYIQRLKISTQKAIFEVRTLNPSHSMPHKIEYTFLGVWQIIKTLIGDQINLHDAKIYFDYPKPDYVDEYRDYFECECYFNQEKCEIQFPKSWLSLSSKDKKDSYGNQLLFANLLSTLPKNATYTDKVEHLLREHGGENLPDFSQVIESLCITASQLRKKLLEEGTNYKKLLTECKMKIAQHYLQSSTMPVKTISYLLGYSQQSAFDRAFKNFHGKPPVEFRKQVLMN